MQVENHKDGGFYHIEIETEPRVVREAIEKRLDFVRQELGFPDDLAPLKVDEGALNRLEQISQNSPGLALLALRLAVQQVLPTKTIPCTITSEDIDSLGITTEDLEQLWDSPLRDAIII